MSGMNTMAHTALHWLTEQHQAGRRLFLMIDSMAEPNPVPALFGADLMQEYVNLYQSTELDDLAEVGPWLIRLPEGSHAQVLADLLDHPQRNWGWLASAQDLALDVYAQHWRERMVSGEQGSRVLYRFQDNRVLGHHLAALPDVHVPMLIGPAEAMLCWHQEAWVCFANPAPAQGAAPTSRPWLEVPEPEYIRNEIQRHNLQQWLWQQHAEATTRLACNEPFQQWLDHQLGTARRWQWESTEQIQFLLQHQLDVALVSAPFWTVQEGETPNEHYQRCRQMIGRLQRSHA